MPFARHSGYSFTAVSVAQNAPPSGGVYGLSNANGWIYIEQTDNIRASLLERLRERVPVPDLRPVTGFTYEVCEPDQRGGRCKRLIEELHPQLVTLPRKQ